MGFSSYLQSQDKLQIDSLATEVCQSIDKESIDLDFPDRLDNSLFIHFTNIENNRQWSFTEEEFNFLLYRLQRNCHEMKKFVYQLDSTNTIFKRVNEEPVSYLSAQEAKLFKEFHQFKYQENDTTFTNVLVSDTEWIYNHEDGTTSKYEMHWVQPNTFYVQYIESNNETRETLNIKGDTYHYKILDYNENGSFLVCEWVEGTDWYSIFSLIIEE